MLRSVTLRRWLFWAMIAAWILELLVTVTLLVVLRGKYILACQVPGTDSSYGTAKISAVPLGL